MTKLHSLKVKLPSGVEQITIGNNIAGDKWLSEFVAGYDKRIIVVDARFAALHPGQFKQLTEALMPDEIIQFEVTLKLKCYDTIKQLSDRMVEANAGRKSCIIAVGGGTLGDTAGFFASIFMRGIDYVQIPTTLMSMADAIIGKVAIDHGDHKNLFGAYMSPRLVICDVALLRGLPPRQLAEGMVEIWKHSILIGDIKRQAQISDFSRSQPTDLLADLVEFSLRIKKSFVEADHTETRGVHVALSLGHTLSNYLEKRYGVTHGQGVLVGITHAVLLSKQAGIITEGYSRSLLDTALVIDRELDILSRFTSDLDSPDLFRYLHSDKINHHGELFFVVPTGKGYAVRSFTPDQIIEAYATIRTITQ